MSQSAAIELMGRPPINPIGSCFDSTAVQAFEWIRAAPFKICHGVGVATMPGQEGREIGHCWLERDGMAFDTTWGAKVDADKYRADLRLSYVVEYDPLDWLRQYLETNYPGPWDPKIKAITDRKTKE